MALFRSFFFGHQLSEIEYACIASFIARGHYYVLYCYDPVAVPPGVVIADASKILGADIRDGFFEVAPGRVSQFSNGFRYQLLYQQGGWWVDTDVACLSAEVPPAEIVFGFEDETLVGSAILRFPKQHPLLHDAFRYWRANQNVEKWGYTGPQAMTRFVVEHGLRLRALPAETLYPINWREAACLLDPKARLQVQERVAGKPFLHVWQSALTFNGIPRHTVPPPGCFLREAIGPS